MKSNKDRIAKLEREVEELKRRSQPPCIIPVPVPIQVQPPPSSPPYWTPPPYPGYPRPYVGDLPGWMDRGPTCVTTYGGTISGMLQ